MVQYKFFIRVVARRDGDTFLKIGNNEVHLDVQEVSELVKKLNLALEQQKLATPEDDTRAETPTEDRYFAH